MNKQIIINGRDLNNFKTLDEALKEIENTIKGCGGELNFLFITGMNSQKARNMVIRQWNELYKDDKDNNKLKQEKSQDNKLDIREVNQKKTPEKNDIVKILVKPFKDKEFKVVDTCKDMRTVLIDLGDDFQNTFRLGFEDVEVVHEREKIIEEELDMYYCSDKLGEAKLKVTKDKTYVIIGKEGQEVVGDVSCGYEDENFDKDRCIEIAYWHCVKNYAKQKLR